MKRITKKLIILTMTWTFLIGGSGISTAGAASSPDVFKDVSSHWAKAQIEEAVAKGYVAGYPNGTFKPDAPVTRAQFITMLVRALELEHGPEGSIWYTTYVKAAKEAAIYQGDSDFAEWNMNKEISREHMAWLAARAADETLVTVESSGIVKEVEIYRWPEVPENNVVRTDDFMRDYYEGFLTHTAFARGILNGFGGNVIGLERTTTRAQAVTVIERILSLKAGKKLPADKYATAEAELLWLKTNAFTMAPHLFDDPNGSSMKKKYHLEGLVFKNNVIHTEIQRIILIDLDDPKDPYRKLLPQTNKLGFLNGNIGKVPEDAYAMYIEYETISNKNPKQYWGNLSLTTQSYVSVNGKDDALTQPARLNTNDPLFTQINMIKPSESGVGKGITVWGIPNSGFSLYKPSGSNKKSRGLNFTFYIKPIYGDDDIRNYIFIGSTTHYGK
ncbi:hypothetical protein A7K91_12340 [Paenibacillus oryzae]|uniref:SLH domain-containing protein n=1 Tax=Paenibacillus oryzae TaxID=1844972 RepID=A0A1A5YFD9_9BACL|nr:S-layer homology domain-containing protein [Paenibacillus oryzae]OBR64303.1 hypothetical protein A7K91_12340 [Paenibacillus oryzae]